MLSAGLWIPTQAGATTFLPMAITPEQLLLTDERRTQLTAALTGTGMATPLETLITEAESEVARLTRGYVIPEASQQAWARALTLWRAFVVAELGVPDDVKAGYEAAMEELTAIAEGRRPNLEREDLTPGATTGGRWGSSDRIALRI